VVPAAILIWDVVSGPWACDTTPVYSGNGLPENTSYYTCVGTPFGPLTTYHVMAAFFLVIALAGLTWLLRANLMRQARQPAHG